MNIPDDFRTEAPENATGLHPLDRSAVEYLARCRLFRAPSPEELYTLSRTFESGGFGAVCRTLDIRAQEEKIGQLDRAALIGRLLGTFTFYQKDMGSLNEIGEAGIFVVSGPKCGTTTIANRFRRHGEKVFAIHNDSWLRYYISNGRILDDFNISFAEIFEYLKPRRPSVFFGFRDPISWYFALAGELRLSMNLNLMDELPSAIHTEFPWSVLRFEESQRILEDILGISIYDLSYDQSIGYSIHELPKAQLILYRIEALDSLLAALEDEGRISSGQRERVNFAEDYRQLAASARYGQKVLDELFDAPLVKYFYSSDMIAKFKGAYLR